jgi:acetyl esterase
MRLESPELNPSGQLQSRQVCREQGGAEEAPALSWNDVPPKTQSFALIADDPDAMGARGFTHWVVVNIPASSRSLSPPIGVPGLNGQDGVGYRGACPNKGTGSHHYRFRLFALNTLLPARQYRQAELENVIRGHVLAVAELVGRYENRSGGAGLSVRGRGRSIRIGGAAWNLDPETRRFLAAIDSEPAQGQTLGSLLARASASSPSPSRKRQIRNYVLPVGPTGKTPVRIVWPSSAASSNLPIIMYFHGGAWVSGGWTSHGGLARELSERVPAILVFVEYALSPAAKFPVALEQCYAATRYIANLFREVKIAVAGDSVGGTLATAICMLALQRGTPRISGQALLCPATDAALNSPSAREFADGPWATRQMMADGWNAYIPARASASNPLISPLRAERRSLVGMPPALVITAENDVLRDEGEAYARRLAEAGTPVVSKRYQGTIHGFLDIEALAHSPAALAGRSQLVLFLRSINFTRKKA